MNGSFGRRARVVGVLVVLSLLLSMVPLGSAVAISPLAATVVLDSATVNLTGPADSKPFSVILHINGVPATKLGGYDFGLTFNPAAMQIGTITGLNATFGAPFVSDVNNATGTIALVDFDAVGIAAGNYDMLLINGTAISDVAGVFPIHFTKSDIVDANGDDIVDTQTDGNITINLPPVACKTHTYTDANGSGTLDAGEPIQFTSTCTTNNPTSWLWDFGDSTTSTLQNPTKTYTVTGTYTVTFTATNAAGSSTITQTITVAPNSLATVELSPANPSLMVNTTQQFTATGKDQYGNTIGSDIVPAAPNAWTWTATAALGTISNTGLLTVGNTQGTYPNGVCAKGAYKAGTVTGCTNVTVVSIVGVAGKETLIDTDGVAVLVFKIVDTIDPITLVHKDVVSGLGDYLAKATYNGTKINYKGIRGGQAPFDLPPLSVNIDNLGGQTTWGTVQTAMTPGPQAPIKVSREVLILIGSALETVTLTQEFLEISATDGTVFDDQGPIVKTYRRGDCKADGVVNIADALFGAQYLAGLRQADEDITKVHAINCASVKHDNIAPEGGDKITISDVLKIAQYLVGIVGPNF